MPAEAESRDLSALLVDPSAPWPDEAFYKEQSHSMLVRHGRKLMRANIAGRTVYEFYNLLEQPAEGINRVDDPAFAAEVAAMRADLDAWHYRQESQQGQPPLHRRCHSKE